MGRISVRQENMLVFCAYMYVCMYVHAYACASANGQGERTPVTFLVLIVCM